MASELYVHDASDEEQNMKILGGPFLEMKKILVILMIKSST